MKLRLESFSVCPVYGGPNFSGFPTLTPSRMLVVDSMHNLFLGLLKEHFRGILGFRFIKTRKSQSASADKAFHIVIPEDDSNPPPPADKASDVKAIITLLQQPMSVQLKDPKWFFKHDGQAENTSSPRPSLHRRRGCVVPILEN